jgi:hypothetical protein
MLLLILIANWFSGAANATQNAIDLPFNFVASLFDGAVNATKNVIDATSE